MSAPLPDGFVEVSPDRSVTTEELLQLNAVAIEQGHRLAINEHGAAQLEPGERHHGTVILFTDDAFESPDAHGGMRTHSDAWLIVTWLLQLKSGDRAPALMGCRAAAWFGLDPGTIDDRERSQVHLGALDQLRQMAAAGLVVPNRAGELTSLIVPDNPF